MLGHIIFDADGVVVDSRATAWDASARIRALFDGPCTIRSPDEAEAIFGVDAQVRLVGEQYAPVLRQMHRLLMRQAATALPLFREVLGVISRLSARRTIVTAALADGVHAALVQEGFDKLFDEILGFETGGKADILKRLNPVPPSVYVTDTVRDINICKAIGLPVVAVSWGYDLAEHLRTAAPDFIVKDARELSVVLKALIHPRH